MSEHDKNAAGKGAVAKPGWRIKEYPADGPFREFTDFEQVYPDGSTLTVLRMVQNGEGDAGTFERRTIAPGYGFAVDEQGKIIENV